MFLVSGTMAASCELVKKAKGKVLGCLCLVGLSDLDGLANVPHACHCFIDF